MSIENYKKMMVQAGAIDPVGLHHEFFRGMHGRKIDQDKVNDSPELLGMLVAEAVEFIEENYNPLPDMLVSVAGGTIPVVEPLAKKLDHGVGFAHTEKPDGTPVLTEEAIELIKSKMPGFVLVVEDVATTGSSSLLVAEAILALGVKRVEVLNLWQRTPSLPKLDEAKVAYKSMIVDYETVPTYPPDDCRHCLNGWKLIPYPRN